MPDEKLYTKNEMESIIAQRTLESNRDERVHLIETGFADLSSKVLEGNNLKVELLDKMNFQDAKVLERLGAQDSKIADITAAVSQIPAVVESALKARWTKKWKWAIASTVTTFGFLVPFLVVLLDHVWVSSPHK